jgi:hypothetical protein
MSTPSLDMFVGQRVVLDTAGPLIYIGKLEAHDERGYWLADADMHDRNEGHSTKEEYVSESRELEHADVPRANRRRVFVDRQAVISISALDDVI